MEKATHLFFAETQNKMLYGVTGKTAAEIIDSRADSDAPNMALKSWSGSIVRKTDVVVAKNYLTSDEIDVLNRLVTIFLESAELHVKMRKDLTLNFWRASVDKLLLDHSIPLLQSHGKYPWMKQKPMLVLLMKHSTLVAKPLKQRRQILLICWSWNRKQKA